MSNTRPKVGIALSGASGRAIAHIGVLEVLRENNIPIDYVVGCSSGGAIAVLGEGHAFGEMSLLSGGPRTATIRAVEDTDLLEIGKDDFDRLVAADRQLAEL